MACPDAGRRYVSRYALQSNAAPLAAARSLLADQLDAGAVERIDDLDQAVDHAAHIAAAALHALDGRHRQAAISASAFWSMPSSARAARICAPVIMPPSCLLSCVWIFLTYILMF
jgi:hypothetical protein